MRLFLWSSIKRIRSFHSCSALTSSAAPKVDKQQLSKLRKKTGFPFIKCREALVKFENDAKEAEKWMREMALQQGWATAGKLADRPMSQGLIGILGDDKCAVMVEVNCETDFVARNNSFQRLVSAIAESCLHEGMSRAASQDKMKIEWTRKEIENLTPRSTDGQKISDMIAVSIGSVGENMRVRRAGFMKSSYDRRVEVSHYCHTTLATASLSSSSRCQFGRYGSLLQFERRSDDKDVSERARNVCQHIVGMNPSRIGSLTEDKPSKNIDDETILIYQPYLLNEEQTIENYVETHLWPVDYLRYQCGESLPTDDE